MQDEAFLADLGELLETDPSELTPEFELTGENWDSLAIVGVIVLIHDHYETTVDAAALSECTSIAMLRDLIAQRTGA